MTLEELEIVVSASIEPAIKEIKKLMPKIKQQVEQVVETTQKSMEQIDMKNASNKIQQSIQKVKNKIENLKKSNKNNEILIKVNNKEASKQISQVQKQIDSLQEKINARQMKLDVINPQMDKIVEDTRRSVTPDGISQNSNVMDNLVDNELSKNKDFSSLSNQAQKLYSEIEMYSNQLKEAKNNMTQLKQETNQTATTQNKLSSFFSGFKGKIEQAKSSTKGLKGTFSQIPKITQNITNNIKGMGKNLKGGLSHIFKYAAALFSLRGIYSVLSNCAQAWLSSQNSGAQQISANIEYMKYAMGSALAPVIQFVTNLVYQLMRAIQSVAYALTGVNIFAKATASSMKSTAGSAKQASKSLAGVHNEINNISDNDNNSGGGGSIGPNMDLSEMDNTPNSIVEAIKNGDWYQVGATIGQKLNEAMDSIPWDKIQNGAKKIGTNIAQFLNGYIAKTNWKQVGNTLAQGINTIIYFAYSFVMTFDWKQFGIAIGDSINGFFENVDWAIAGQTLSDGVRGILSTVSNAISEIDWFMIGESIWDFLVNIDWNGIIADLASIIGKLIGALSQLLAGFLIDAVIGVSDFFGGEIEECGGNIVLGILKGIGDAMIGIGIWLYENLVKPLVDGFCELLGIHSPSTVFEEFGQYIIQGLFNGIESLVESIKQIWKNIKETAEEIFNAIGEFLKNTWQGICNVATNIWNGIKTAISDIIEGIKKTISNVLNGIKTIWNNIWNGLKKTVSNIFNGIWNTIKRVVNSILGAVESMANGIVNGVNAVIRVLNNLRFEIPDWVPGMGGKTFGFNINTLNTVSLPRLAKGNVAYSETMAIFGEYSGASNNPEITAPQNILKETFDEVLLSHEWNSNNDNPINLSVYVADKKLGDILINDLRNRKRQTGKGIEALVGG